MTGLINLNGKKGLVLGIANKNSIAYGCAKQLRSCGAELAIPYLNEKAEKHVRPVAEELESDIIMPCNVQAEGELEAVFAAIKKKWGKLDFLVHSIAFAPADDLNGPLVDCSLKGFLTAMDVSCHSFIRMAQLAEPLMKDGGTMLTMSYYGSNMVVKGYNMMGPVKAALESTSKYLAAELGSKNIRVHALSPGPVRTRAASGIAKIDRLIEDAESVAPIKRGLVDVEDIGAYAAFLVSDYAKSMTGSVSFVDGGYNIMD
ncbi:MAG: enoyl-ACP reductase FabI [Alphaproteobacteria bacterium]